MNHQKISNDNHAFAFKLFGICIAVFIAAIIALVAVSIFREPFQRISDYQNVDPHRISCVEGTVLQPDGSCASQEINQ